jgi:hypothetical protein
MQAGRDTRPRRAGEPFEVFYLREYHGVVRLAYALSGSRLAAEDIAQDAFLGAYLDWERIRCPAAWVRDDTVMRIDPATDRVVATIPADHPPGQLAAAGGAVWVALGERGLGRIDPARNRMTRVPASTCCAGELAAGAGALWVANLWDRTVVRVDPNQRQDRGQGGRAQDRGPAAVPGRGDQGRRLGHQRVPAGGHRPDALADRPGEQPGDRHHAVRHHLRPPYPQLRRRRRGHHLDHQRARRVGAGHATAALTAGARPIRPPTGRGSWPG